MRLITRESGVLSPPSGARSSVPSIAPWPGPMEPDDHHSYNQDSVESLVEGSFTSFTGGLSYYYQKPIIQNKSPIGRLVDFMFY
jgi:hypothetical protein